MHVWRDRMQRWLSPLARACPFSPNTITLIALGLSLVASACFYLGGRRPALFLVGMIVVVFAGLADAFDGVVARVQKSESRYGDFLDHFADRVADLFLAAGWMIGSGVREEITVVAIIGVMLNGYIGTQIEATWGERDYSSVGRAEFVLALVIFPIVSFTLFSNGWSPILLARLRITEWMTILLAVFAVLGIVQRLVLASRMARS
ncbi:MAG: CDP-alcohol phosphatidyltransferase family protein [Thermoanaerobaculia bacterium]